MKRTPSPRNAPVGARALAALLDGLLLLALSAPLMWLAYREPVARLTDLRPLSLAINWGLPALLCIAFWTWQGATPGKLIAGIRVVDARSGARPSLAQSLRRWLGYFASVLPLGLGLAWAAVDAEGRGWHDKLAGTRVVRRLRRDGTLPADGEGYIARHWRGEQGLVQSFWVNNVLLSYPLAFALTGLMTWISMKGETLQAGSIALLIGWPLMLVVDAWCIVGAWRAAGHYLRNGGLGLWGWLARLCLLLGAAQALASLLIGLLPQLGSYWQMARGIDPIGQARFALAADGRSLRLSGPIGMGDAARLQALLQGAPALRTVELASPGGRLSEAERMAGQLRSIQASTRAVGGCESACTLVFLAGRERQLMPGARLGFHRASSGTYNPVFDRLANEQLASDYRQLQLPDYFIERTLETPARGMWYPDSAELVAQAVIAAPPQTLDIVLPPDGAAAERAPLADYVDALRANAAWYALDKRFPELLGAAAARMRAVPAADGEAAAQDAALQALAPIVAELVLAGPPESRRRYLAIVRAQLAALQQEAGGAAICQAWLGGRLEPRRHWGAALTARETAWLIAAAGDPPARWLPRPPTPLELEVVQRVLGAQAPGLLARLWTPEAGALAAARPLPDCARSAQLLDRIARLPAQQRELAERVVFQPLRN
ncbi:MAG: RDD family protein [Burkholderiaceae bacterium]